MPRRSSYEFYQNSNNPRTPIWQVRPERRKDKRRAFVTDVLMYEFKCNFLFLLNQIDTDMLLAPKILIRELNQVFDVRKYLDNLPEEKKKKKKLQKLIDRESKNLIAVHGLSRRQYAASSKIPKLLGFKSRSPSTFTRQFKHQYLFKGKETPEAFFRHVEAGARVLYSPFQNSYMITVGNRFMWILYLINKHLVNELKNESRVEIEEITGDGATNLDVLYVDSREDDTVPLKLTNIILDAGVTLKIKFFFWYDGGIAVV